MIRAFFVTSSKNHNPGLERISPSREAEVCRLFDKSFLQALNLDESALFDHFFTNIVCPIFYVETLADLSKQSTSRTPEQIVGSIASKFPDMHGSPCANHVNIAISELLTSHRVSMDGNQIPVSGGYAVRAGDETGIVFERSPESEAFSRWQSGEFKQIERNYAADWRAALEVLDLDQVGATFKKLGIDGKSCRSMSDAKAIADAVVGGSDRPFERMLLAVLFLNAPPDLSRQILERWSVYGKPPLRTYAPYAAFVVNVEIFFQVCIASNLISAQRASNRVDIAYIFYLPFCRLFVSSDRLHERCVQPFLSQNQEFVWGQDLKDDLKNLNRHFMETLTDEQKERGLLSGFVTVPYDDDSLVCQLWDRHVPGWRTKRNDVDLASLNDEKTRELVDRVNRVAEAPPINAEDIDFDPADADSMTLKRLIRRKKGSWYQVPKELAAD